MKTVKAVAADQTTRYLFIGLVVIASIVAGAIVGQLTVATDVKAANCDKADVERNPSGNARGNGHECAFPEFPESDTNPEPVRDCDKNGGSNAQHKNSFKDNDDDGFAGCVTRGDEEH